MEDWGYSNETSAQSMINIPQGKHQILRLPVQNGTLSGIIWAPMGLHSTEFSVVPPVAHTASPEDLLQVLFRLHHHSFLPWPLWASL